MAIMDIQVSPRSKGSVSVSDAVVLAHRRIQETGLPHMLHPMGTCVEGEARQLYQLAADIHQALVEAGYERVGMVLKVDDRRDKPAHMEHKVGIVQSKLAL
jgi:uncharacterized protein (TIGR00106 family)